MLLSLHSRRIRTRRELHLEDVKNLAARDGNMSQGRQGPIVLKGVPSMKFLVCVDCLAERCPAIFLLLLE